MNDPKIVDLPPLKTVIEIKMKNGKTRRRVMTTTQGVSRTLQEPALDADIHNMMKKYVHTHGPIPMAQISETILDFTNVTDYQTSLNNILEAQEAFNSLPAPIRADFKNDPAHLISFINDEANYDKAVAYGFILPETANLRSESKKPKGPPNDPNAKVPTP